MARKENTTYQFSNEWYTEMVGIVKIAYSPYTIKLTNVCKSKKPKPPKK